MTVGDLINLLEAFEDDDLVQIWDTRLETFAPAENLSTYDGRVRLGPEEEGE